MSEAEPVPPGWIFKIAIWLTGLIDAIRNLITPTPVRVLEKGMAALGSAILYSCCSLKIPEAIGNNWTSTASVAAKTGVDEDILERILKAMYQNGFFQLRGTASKFEVRHNRFSKILKEDAHGTVKPVMMHLQKDCLPMWVQLDVGLLTVNDRAKPSTWEVVFGEAPWDFFAKNPERGHTFSQAMRAFDTAGLGALLADHKWSQYSRILDIGGAFGSVASEILNITKANGVICDLDFVVKDGIKNWENRKAAGDRLATKVLPRLSFEAIDFFKKDSIPKAKDGDAFIMRNVLHDWPDKECIEILKNLRHAMGNAKATFVNMELNSLDLVRSPIRQAQTLIDMHMIPATRGKERTELQWREIFAKTGFRIADVKQTRGTPVIWTVLPIP